MRGRSKLARWARYGAYAGFALAMVGVEAGTPASLGFYVGAMPLPLLFALCIGGGAACGALLALLDGRPPPGDES